MPEGLDELLFLNERGEVCDGTITTLFFDRGEGLRTPPLSCGLLAGVLRAELASAWGLSGKVGVAGGAGFMWWLVRGPAWG